MSTFSSETFTYQDSAGNGITGADIKLRRKGASNFGTDVYTATEVSGIAGSYNINQADIPFDLYKAWINGNENKSFGGDYGVYMGNPFLSFAALSEFLALLDSYAALVTTVASKMPKSGGNFTGQVNFSDTANFQAEPTADWADHETTANSSALVSVARLNYAVASSTGGLQYFTTVSVVPGKADNPGIQYNTVKKAVDFCLLTGMASATKRFRVVIENMPTGASYINIEAGCFHNYIDIKGADQSIMVKPADANPSALMRLENLTLFLSTAAGNRIFTGISTKEINVQGFNNVTFKGGTHSSNDISVPSNKTVTFDKTAGGEYADVKRCLSRVDPTFTDGEAYDKARDCRFESGLTLIVDPDIF